MPAHAAAAPCILNGISYSPYSIQWSASSGMQITSPLLLCELSPALRSKSKVKFMEDPEAPLYDPPTL